MTPGHTPHQWEQPSAQASFLRRHGQKLMTVVFWLILLAGSQWYARRHHLSTVDVVQRLAAFLADSVYGPLLYISIYAIRPLLLCSAIAVTMTGGFVFGTGWGFVYAFIGELVAASVAYGLGHHLGHDGLGVARSQGRMVRYLERLRLNTFETVLIMRYLLLPYDPVSYLVGFLQLRWRPFILATAVGALPGITLFLLAGSSLHTATTGLSILNLRSLTVVGTIFGLSLVIARFLSVRRKHQSA